MSRLVLALVVAASVVAAGCAEFADFGGRNCEIKPGSFSCQLGGAGDISLAEDWQNNASKANVTVQLGGSGSVNVTIYDADNRTVFEESYTTETGGTQETRATESGTPGEWRVEVTGSYQGGMQIEVESA